MKVLAVIILGVFLFSCATKKERVNKYSCEDIFNQIVQTQEEKNEDFQVYSYVYFEGKTVLMKGKFNRYGGGTIKFYLPIGKKVATVKKNGEDFCLKEGSECKRIQNPFRKIGISVEKLITKRFNVSKFDRYTCNGNSLMINKPGFSLVYKNGKLRNVLIKNILINYKSDKEIYVYDTGKLIARFKISKIVYER